MLARELAEAESDGWIGTKYDPGTDRVDGVSKEEEPKSVLLRIPS